MIPCPSCKTMISPNAAACPSCGEPMVRKSQSRGKLGAFAMIVAGVIGYQLAPPGGLAGSGAFLMLAIAGVVWFIVMRSRD